MKPSPERFGCLILIAYTVFVIVLLFVLLRLQGTHKPIEQHHAPKHTQRHNRRRTRQIQDVTYYRDSVLACGMTYRQAIRRYRYFEANNRYPFGTVLKLTSRAGRTVRVVVLDRIGRGTDNDLCMPAARHFFKELSIGRMQTKSVKVIGKVRIKHHGKRNTN